jgi:SPP1 family predicted phage head-tail adaptor
MAYQAGFLNHRVLIRNKKAPTAQSFGDTTDYEDTGCVWANVSFVKGIKALHEGALDAYDTVMFRMRWNNLVKRDSQLVYHGVTYQILSFHEDFQENIIQITAQEIVK